ncbi:MAG: hypothetical protein KME57_02190 [Scytonema hyalinum WJT4-NPBG1]|jgi:hypothetical protein|nr:hypothetical protein [Scytonema hyalinum WJT4-NPBG1]
MSLSSNSCPCCGGSLLRHVRHGEFYWFCKTCWQEVPLLSVSRMPNAEARSTGVVPQPVVKS